MLAKHQTDYVCRVCTMRSTSPWTSSGASSPSTPLASLPSNPFASKRNQLHSLLSLADNANPHYLQVGSCQHQEGSSRCRAEGCLRHSRIVVVALTSGTASRAMVIMTKLSCVCTISTCIIHLLLRCLYRLVSTTSSLD
jgi:hypothetical protein